MFGSYRAPTGVGEAAAVGAGATASWASCASEVARLQEKLGRRPKILVGKPGLDGHSNGAEQIAVRARDAGMDVVYEGIRLTPAQIAASALQEGVHVIGLSILSGSHRELIPAVIDALHDAGVTRAGGRRRDHPRAGRRGAARRRASPPSTRPRTSTSPASCATSWRSSARAPSDRRVAAAGGAAANGSGVSADGAALGARLRERDLSAAPAALNLLESTAADDREQAAALLREVSPAALGGEAPAHVIGVTGPPGAGKSTLLSALLHAWRRAGAHRTVAMLAVDPSSRRSGGSLLGDRARIEFDPADRGVLIRSTAAGERLGGLARATRAPPHALAAAFDIVVIETVGVGQAETDVADVADTVAVVVQPGSGDVLQFLKSGIMEIPDVLVVTKADLGQIALRARARPERRAALARLRRSAQRARRLLAASPERHRRAGGGAR